MKVKNKKNPLLVPVTVLSLLIFVLFFLTFLISPTPQQSPKPPISPKIPSTPKSSFFSLLTSRPTSHFQPLTSLVAVGDIMLGRFVNIKMLQKNDWRYPFLKTASLTSTADITFGNLESPIVEGCPTRGDGMIFCARPEAIEGLNFAGFDILSLANNHTLNYDQKGLEQTINLLDKNNILSSQSNKITRYQANNINFGFLSFDLVTYPQTSLIPLISLTSPTVDILIVSLHWGNEYQKNPTQQQINLVREIIDAGAKIIIGHHPHVTQPVEKYKDGLIFYSLGNFVFDQPWSEETKKGEIAKIIFEGKEIKSYELIPIYIENSSQPEIKQ